MTTILSFEIDETVVFPAFKSNYPMPTNPELDQDGIPTGNEVPVYTDIEFAQKYIMNYVEKVVSAYYSKNISLQLSQNLPPIDDVITPT